MLRGAFGALESGAAAGVGSVGWGPTPSRSFFAFIPQRSPSRSPRSDAPRGGRGARPGQGPDRASGRQAPGNAGQAGRSPGEHGPVSPVLRLTPAPAHGSDTRGSVTVPPRPAHRRRGRRFVMWSYPALTRGVLFVASVSTDVLAVQRPGGEHLRAAER